MSLWVKLLQITSENWAICSFMKSSQSICTQLIHFGISNPFILFYILETNLLTIIVLHFHILIFSLLPTCSFICRFVRWPPVQLHAGKPCCPGCGVWQWSRTGLLACEKQVDCLFPSNIRFKNKPSLQLLFDLCNKLEYFSWFQLGVWMGRRRLYSDCQEQEQSLRHCNVCSLPFTVDFHESLFKVPPF